MLILFFKTKKVVHSVCRRLVATRASGELQCRPKDLNIITMVPRQWLSLGVL